MCKFTVRTIQIYIVCLLAGLNRFNEIRGHSHHRLTMDDWNILTEDKTLCDHEVQSGSPGKSIYLFVRQQSCVHKYEPHRCSSVCASHTRTFTY